MSTVKFRTEINEEEEWYKKGRRTKDGHNLFTYKLAADTLTGFKTLRTLLACSRITKNAPNKKSKISWSLPSRLYVRITLFSSRLATELADPARSKPAF